MYAHLLHVVPDVLLYSGIAVWVVRTGVLTHPADLRVGFVFLAETPLLKAAAGPD
jgi:hypothetical protein